MWILLLPHPFWKHTVIFLCTYLFTTSHTKIIDYYTIDDKQQSMYVVIAKFNEIFFTYFVKIRKRKKLE